MDNFNTIRNLIREYRILKGLTQSEIAKRMYITQSAYSRLETGNTKIDTNRLISIAEILEIDFNKVFISHYKNKNSIKDLTARQNKILQEEDELKAIITKKMPIF